MFRVVTMLAKVGAFSDLSACNIFSVDDPSTGADEAQKGSFWSTLGRKFCIQPFKCM